MRCLTVAPGQKDSIRLDERPDPAPQAGWTLIEAVALGVCGTDRDIIAGDYGWAPPGEEPAGSRPRVARPRARGAGRLGS